jgi:hypothetical protein
MDEGAIEKQCYFILFNGGPLMAPYSIVME